MPHASVTLTGPQGRSLERRLAHYVDRNISDMLIRLDRYTTLRAQDLRESGDIGSFARNLRRIATRFWESSMSAAAAIGRPVRLSDRPVRGARIRSCRI